MKKNIIIAAFLLLGAATATAQKGFKPELSFGATGGMTLSKMNFSPTIVQKYLPGPTIGVAFRYISEKYFGIQAEIRYTSRGWKDYWEDYPEYNFERRLNYLEVPILTHIYFGNNRIRGFVNLGPQLSFFLNDSSTGNMTDVSELQTEHHTLAVDNKFDYGITGGGGLELRFRGKHSFLLEGRYYFGLGDIFPNQKKDTFEASASRSISISLTYLFNIL